MINPTTVPIYLHFQDFVDGVVGPFSTTEAAQEHLDFCKARGDGATFHGVLTEGDEKWNELKKRGALFISAEEDRDLTYPDFPVSLE